MRLRCTERSDLGCTVSIPLLELLYYSSIGAPLLLLFWSSVTTPLLELALLAPDGALEPPEINRFHWYQEGGGAWTTYPPSQPHLSSAYYIN